jgi:hypothetical protein
MRPGASSKAGQSLTHRGASQAAVDLVPSSTPPARRVTSMAKTTGSPARRRLEQAHHLWHRALDSYALADDFCPAVNSLLQTLRTVTWVLQKSLRHRDGFDAWYADRQREMSDDPLMRWAVEARNHIEKEGDLDLQSTARVSIVASWLAAPYDDFEIQPLIAPEAIAAALLPRNIPDRIRRDGVLAVERRWVTASLPDHELLDACAHVYQVLDGIVSEAESDFGGQAKDDSTSGRGPRRLDCMVAGRDARTARVNLQTGELLAYERIETRPPTPEAMDKAAARYGPAISAIARPDNSLSSRVRWHHQMGRVMLEHDGHHMLVMFVFRGGRPLATIVLEPEDQQDKYVLMEHVAEDILTYDADEVIVSGETWHAPAPADEALAWIRPADRADRSEGFVTYGVNREGRCLTLATPFDRVDGKLVLGDIAASDVYPNALLPIRRAWGG